MAELSDWQDPIYSLPPPPARPRAPRPAWFALAAAVMGLGAAILLRPTPPLQTPLAAPVQAEAPAQATIADELQPLPAPRPVLTARRKSDPLEERQ